MRLRAALLSLAICGAAHAQEKRIIDRQEIAESGIASLGEWLQRLPEQGGAMNANVNGAGDGSTQISFRNLGAQRTLVLVDGKRWVDGLQGAVDLNSIPPSAVDRIEIIHGSGSALYGSDAIGGVVNVVTRKRVSGVEAVAYGGLTEHGDAQQYDLRMTSGVSGERGTLLFSGGWFDQQPLLAGSRGWASQRMLYDFSNGRVFPLVSNVTPASRVSLTPSCGTPVCKDLAAAYGPDRRTFVADPAGVDGWRPFNPAIDVYNSQPAKDLITSSRRLSLFSNGEYRLGESAKAYFQGSFVNRRSSNLLAPAVITDAFVSRDNGFNPFGVDTYVVSRRLAEAGGVSQAFDLDTTRLVMGVGGALSEDFGVLHGLNWDASFNYGHTTGLATSNGTLDTRLISQGLGPSVTYSPGTLYCATYPSPNCVPVNLFGGPGSISSAQLSALGVHQNNDQLWSQVVSARLDLEKALFTLGAAVPVDVSGGYEYRAEYGGYIPDSVELLGADSQFNLSATRGAYHLNEGYLRVDVPVIATLSFQGAARLSSYSTFGSIWSYQSSARWQPIADVTIHGGYSTSFHAPSISDLYRGTQSSAEFAYDPCNFFRGSTALLAQCGSFHFCDNCQIASFIGGNVRLKPEKAGIATIGALIEPRFVKGLSIGLDYWNIALSRSIDYLTSQVILDRCYPAFVGSTAPPDRNACSRITRDAYGYITSIDDSITNVGSVWTSGLDASVRYAHANAIGRFAFLFDATYLIRYKQSLSDGRVISAAGNYDLGSGSFIGGLTPRLRFNAGVDYSRSAAKVGLRARYIGGFDECAGANGTSNGFSAPGLCSNPSPGTDGNGNPIAGAAPFAPRHVSAYLTLDAFVSYALKHAFGATLSAGVLNLFNSNPPVIYSSALTFADPAYQFAGRYMYGRVEQQF